MPRKSFLFLQGVCSPFFSRLAQQLRADGHAVCRVNFNVGDALYWLEGGGVHHRGDVAKLTGLLDHIYAEHDITDQLMFGDQRPVHRPAVLHGEACGVRNHVFEEGYFRPYWVTLEREGVNGHSLLPRDPDWFMAAGEALPDYGDGAPFESSFLARSVHDVIYHLAGFWNPLLYPGYRTHAPVTAPVEYAAYLWRLQRVKRLHANDNVQINQLADSAKCYYVLPLQLNSDAQIRYHSHYTDMTEVLSEVLLSFARHAPSDALLVIKNHPLDIGLVDYAGFLRQKERELDLAGRIVYLESGNLHKLVAHARGVITVNSTVGGVSLGLACPTIALADPIYNLPGLTFQHGLDRFWLNASAPEPELFRRFRNTVIHATQINGGFYCKAGIAMAVAQSAAVLGSERSPLELLLEMYPANTNGLCR
ncbi:capsule biosynthesis protein [Chitinilyticum piscinae]|uniref:Capsular biosynthesis protein n=1 Tax=Chitinilyticum piscinae TaxID=2866724 RepID=A0A8J7FNZ7_9NEIS|nr:capsular biosynthesis protein [Chitinilyticum piscinae]MBE9607836.1 capsular biosynthesis protein [Chitinilyticum piscinae]